MPRRGRRARNAPLYGLPGHAYVYLNYGIHCLVNVVTEAHGSPAAVLIRALDAARRDRGDAPPPRARDEGAATPAGFGDRHDTISVAVRAI